MCSINQSACAFRRIGRKVAAIAVAHRDAGLESPTEHGMVKRTFAGIRREKG